MREFIFTHPWGVAAILLNIPLAFLMWAILFNSARREEAFKSVEPIIGAMDGTTFNLPVSREAFSTETENLDKPQSPGSKDRIDAELTTGVLAFKPRLMAEPKGQGKIGDVARVLSEGKI